MPDAFLGAHAFGDVLVGRHPSAICQRFVYDLNRTSVRGVDDHRISQSDVPQNTRTVFIEVAVKGPGGFAVGDNLAERAAGFQHIRRQTVHLKVTLIADDKPLRGIKQQQALRHVVDRSVQTQCFHPVLLRQFADNKNQHRRYHEHEESGHCDQKSGLLAPVIERRRHGRGCNHNNWKIGQCTRRNHPLPAVDRADQARRAMVVGKQFLLTDRSYLEIPPDCLFRMRVTRQQRAVAMVQGNRSILPERHGRKEFFEGGWRNRPGDDPEKLAVRSGHLMSDDGCPSRGKAAPYQLDQNGRVCSA